MLTKWLQERPLAPKTTPGVPPRRALRGLRFALSVGVNALPLRSPKVWETHFVQKHTRFGPRVETQTSSPKRGGGQAQKLSLFKGGRPQK